MHAYAYAAQQQKTLTHEHTLHMHAQVPLMYSRLECYYNYLGHAIRTLYRDSMPLTQFQVTRGQGQWVLQFIWVSVAMVMVVVMGVVFEVKGHIHHVEVGAPVW